jgi:two-component system, cell cycle response regulator DivK
VRKILIVDNNGSMTSLSRRLERRGYQLLVAENGEQAATLGRIARPQLILVDLGHCGLDGCELTRQLKANPSTGHIPLIAFGDPSMGSGCDQALSAGSDDFVLKPIRFQQLLTKIDWLLEKAAFVPAVAARVSIPALHTH